ncbi:MAG: hypothetical protein ACXWVJ_04520 [Caulobacteraceae bacterium]
MIAIPADAVIKVNPAADEWLRARLARGDQAIDILLDAAAACDAERSQAKEPAAR